MVVPRGNSSIIKDFCNFGAILAEYGIATPAAHTMVGVLRCGVRGPEEGQCFGENDLLCGGWAASYLPAMPLMKLLNALYKARFPEDPWNWHRYSPLLPKRDINGNWTEMTARVWRRWHDGRWEYRQDPESDEDFQARQW